MPSWTADSGGNIRLAWASRDDFFQYLNQTVAPAAAQYGYRIIVEPVPKDEPQVDRI